MQNHHKDIRLVYQYQAWGLFGITVIAWLTDTLLGHQGQVAQAVVAGALLNFVLYAVFMWLGYKSRRLCGHQIMRDMTKALVVKWAIAVVGFAYIFGATSLSAPAVFVGFLLMQSLAMAGLFWSGR